MIAQREAKLINISFKDSIVQFKLIKEKAFSGNVIIRIATAPQWMLSFSLGRLVSVSGGLDPINRWQRNLEIARLDLKVDRANHNRHPEVILDRQMLAQQWVATEVLFDLIQLSQCHNDLLNFQAIAISSNNNLTNLNFPLLDIESILHQAIQDYQDWSAAGLNNYCPSHFPLIHRLESTVDRDLKQVISSIDGNRSLRNLAIYHRHKLIDFTKSLSPLFKLGAISLAAEPRSTSLQMGTTDLFKPIERRDGTKIPLKTCRSQQLVACIDDSLSVYEYLERILTDHGYRSVGIQDPLKIMPSLIKAKPDLIFLDLVMPITNGYEVCEQIRKTPSLKDVPVVILTGKDGLVDRMRAKIVGANGFLGKPVKVASVLKVLDKHLKTYLC